MGLAPSDSSITAPSNKAAATEAAEIKIETSDRGMELGTR